MTETSFIIDLPNDVAREVELAAHAKGVSPAEFLAEAAMAHLGSVAAERAWFAQRARGAKPGTALAFFSRPGGEPPRPGDEVDPP